MNLYQLAFLLYLQDKIFTEDGCRQPPLHYIHTKLLYKYLQKVTYIMVFHINSIYNDVTR
jgi:hypothetical protein